MTEWNWNTASLTEAGVPEDLAAQLQTAHEESLRALTAQHQHALGRLHLQTLLTASGLPHDTARLAAGAVPADALQLTEDGSISNVQALLAGLKEAYPSLFPTERRVALAPLHPPLQQSTLPDPGSMSPEEINSNWGTVRSWLAGL